LTSIIDNVPGTFLSEDPFSFGTVSRNGRIRRLTLHVLHRPTVPDPELESPSSKYLHTSDIVLTHHHHDHDHHAEPFSLGMMPLTFDPIIHNSGRFQQSSTNSPWSLDPRTLDSLSIKDVGEIRVADLQPSEHRSAQDA
jgi:hypothetical protein